MPVADKLIQVAETYGFDGWFINQETEGAEERTLTRDDTVKMQEFIKYFKKQAPEMRLVYYDSMTSEGKMDWQNALTDKNTMFMTDEEGNAVADEMFLNFWWTEDELADKDLLKASGEKAEELGISPYYLSHIFSSQLNISFPSYVAQQRMIMACNLLKDSRKTVTEISYECGFPNMRTFHRCFQKRYECTPTQWRERSHKGTDEKLRHQL